MRQQTKALCGVKMLAQSLIRLFWIGAEGNLSLKMAVVMHLELISVALI